MHSQYNMDADAQKKAAVFSGLFIAGTVIFVAAYIWANIFCLHSFNGDMNADAQLAKLMWENKTLFPDGSEWIFGNQLYVVATPVIAALIYPMVENSSLAVSLASIIMTAAQLSLFIWMLRPFVSRKSLLAALYAIGGGVILGVSVCTYRNSMQLLYTMASYYACYMIGIYLVLGVWLRLLAGNIRVSPAAMAASLLFCACLGAQSLRETLVLIIPLILTEILLRLSGQGSVKSTIYALGAGGFNALGVLIAKHIPVVSHKNIEILTLPKSLGVAVYFARDALSEFFYQAGFDFFFRGKEYFPLGICAVLIFAVNVIAFISALIMSARLIRARRPLPALNILLIFAFISLLGVFAVRVLLSFFVRSIYFFVYFLLSALSFAYIVQMLKRPAARSCAAVLLLVCGTVNFFYNVYPDAAQYRSQRECFYGAAQKLGAEGIDFYYYEYATFHTSGIAACSGGKIDCAPVQAYQNGDSGAGLRPFYTLTSPKFYEKQQISGAALVLESPHLAGISGFENERARQKAEAAVMSKLELMFIQRGDEADLYVYRITDPTVITL